MKCRNLWAILLIGSLLLGCVPNSSPPPTREPAERSPVASADDSGTTILQFAVREGNLTRYESLIDAFEAENPELHIRTVSIEQTLGIRRGNASWPEDAYLLLAAAADVIDAPATREAVQQGALLA